jgi:hypothetical protein
MVEFDLKKKIFFKFKLNKKNHLHLRNNVQRNIPNDHTSDLIDNLFINDRSSGLDARIKARANSGVKLCVAISS